MVKETLKIIKLSLVTLGCLITINTKAQVFLCDSIEVTKSITISECPYFFNFLTQKIDSLQSSNYSIKVDTFFDVEYIDFPNQILNIIMVNDSLNHDRLFIISEGGVYLKGQLVNRIPEGQFIIETHYKKISAYFSNGLLNGEMQEYDKKNGKTFIQNFKNGQNHGDSYILNKNNLITYFCNYKNGVKSMLEYELHENGMVRFLNYYDNGKLLDGSYYKFEGNGSPYLFLKVQNGEVVEENWLPSSND